MKTSYRRKYLDVLLDHYKHLYTGVVLDIGGRDRGKFIKPKKNVEKWINADINEKYDPDIVVDVAEMSEIQSNSIDVINAIELFEHVKKINKGINECYRVLKEGGIIIISVPFMAHIHADPNDYQRWTYLKWQEELLKRGFNIDKFIIIGKFFTHLSQNFKELFKAVERSKYKGSGIFLRIINPLLDKLVKLDSKSFVKNDLVLNNYHNGYLIIAKKPNRKT